MHNIRLNFYIYQMDSNLLAGIHKISAMLFLVIYLIKTILIFSNKSSLLTFSKRTKILEMIVSFAFLVTGIWLYVIIGGIKLFHIIKLLFVFISIPLAVIGFKKQKKGLALLSFFLLVAAYGIAEMSRSKPFIPAGADITTESSDMLVQGGILYRQKCVFCHGADGRKNYRTAKDLTSSSLSEDDISIIIRQGIKGKMPAYDLISINDQNIKALSLYVMSLRVPGDSLHSPME